MAGDGRRAGTHAKPPLEVVAPVVGAVAAPAAPSGVRDESTSSGCALDGEAGLRPRRTPPPYRPSLSCFVAFPFESATG